MKRLLLLLALLGVSVGHAADAAKRPGDNFDLTHWKLTLPVNASGTIGGKATEVPAAQLVAGYTHADYFHTGTNGAMVFWCPVNGATTTGSSYPRSELREMLDPANTAANWSAHGTHRLEAQCRVTEEPSSQKVIIGQIHSHSGNAKPLIKLQFSKGRIEALVKVSPKQGEDRKLIFPQVGLNNDIAYQIKLQDGLLAVTVNGVTQSENIFQNDADWANQTFYFKAGAYCQDNQGPASEGARVSFSRLNISHAVSPEVRRTVGNTPATAMAALLAAGSISPAEPSNPLAPYSGPGVRGVDTSTLTGKVMAGYQGWFNCEGDGAGLGWTHWARHGSKLFAPGNVTVDLWPDMSELPPAERFATGFKLPDDSAAEVFSSHNRETVLRHFRWMREYGIDGVFVQRFANGLNDEPRRRHKDVVLASCREGANREGRAYAVMYDLSGLPAGGVARVMTDWKMLRTQMHLGDDPAYLRHRGKPLVAVWGVGFSSERKPYSLAECRALIEFLKADGCSVLLGVPTGWRELKRDAAPDPALHDVLKLADVVSPWTVGRYGNPQEAARHGDAYWKPDLAWCGEHSLDYLPVVFPGFSWHNLKPESPLGKIPRLKGGFLWSQFVAAKAAGAGMIYVAMFDEVDEGTAIFKCSNHPPVGPTPFLTCDGLPSDYYLWLTGEGTRLLRGERALLDNLPKRTP